MRTHTAGNITVVYPDTVVAAFARNPITMEGFTGTSVTMTVTNGDTGKSVTDRRAPFGSTVFFDLAHYLQAMFDQSRLGSVDYASSVSDNGLAGHYTVSLVFYNGTSVITSFTFSLVGVWASRLPSGNQKLRGFIGYPFTVSLLAESKGNVSYGGTEYSLPSESVNVPVSVTSGETVLKTDEQTVTVEAESGCGDVYLRWIDMYGRYCYWLFLQGGVTTGVVADGEIRRFSTGTDTGISRKPKKVGTSVEICAPLVDVDTFDFLLGLAVSPVISMYDGSGWTDVDIEAGDIVRTREVRQDFIVQLVLPETIVQKL